MIESPPLPRGLSVVVPVYNSQESLNELVARLAEVLTPLSDQYEIILVDDASRDGSWSAIERLAGECEHVRAIGMMRNYGQHNAVLCGIRAARFDRVITMDDDLQHPPEEIPRLVARLDEGHDVVYGTPDHEQHGLWRDLASQLTKIALQSAMGIDIARRVGPFRALRTQLRDAFATYSSSYVSIDVLLTWATTRFGSVVVRHDPRRAGVSNYTLRKLVVHALNMITGFSTWPLQLASMLGFGCTLLGVVLLVYVIGRFVAEGSAVPGFAFIASTVAIFSGAQLFALGVIGEYLARMHFRMMERPTYAVRRRVRTKVGD